MENSQPTSVSLDMLDFGIKIGEGSISGSKISIPQSALEDLIQFLTYHSNINKSEDRRSFRLNLEPNTISTTLATETDSVVVTAEDLSLGGMCVNHDNNIPEDLKEGHFCLMRINFEDEELVLKCKIVRMYGDQLAVSFIDCETNGKLTPLPKLANLYSKLQQRWLAERIQK